MPQDEFIAFQQFSTPEDAEYLVALLQENGIEVVAQDTTPFVDLTLNNNDTRKSLEVRIRQADFAAAHEILENNAAKLLQLDDELHPLHQFSKEELIEVVEKEDQWSKIDYLLALKFLEKKGIQFSPEELAAIRQRRLEELRKPVKGETGWLVIGFILALMGGFLGLAIGYIYYSAHKTLPSGERVPTYDKRTRNTAQLVMVIGIVVVLIGLLSLLFERR